MLPKPNCRSRNCRFFLGSRDLVEGDEASEVVYCSAFPNGIPDEIAYGDNKHESPVDGDNGILFEKDPRVT